MKTRIDIDSLGEVEVISDALYGSQTKRAMDNFYVVQEKVHPEMIIALAQVKKACALANYEVGEMDTKITDLIVQACDEIIAGQHKEWFITTALQGGAGTSVNMNMNEVISNRAAQLLNEPLGKYLTVHPNDHVNLAQSTNDVIPTAAKIAVIKMLEKLLVKMEDLTLAFENKGHEYKDVLKVGRTHLQDAVIMTMGQAFHSFSSMVDQEVVRLKRAIPDLYQINIGATAVGSEINTVGEYKELAVKHLKDFTGYPFTSYKDLFYGTKSVDSFVGIHSLLKGFAVDLSRIANDIRLMASGPKSGFGEITLPSVQPGSSIMPGKVNPVILELTNQVCFQVFGNDVTINFAAEAGQMELNVFEPVLFFNLFQSIDILTNICETLSEKAIKGLIVNRERNQYLVDNSLAMATVFTSVLGYSKTSEVTKKALAENKTLKEVLLEDEILSQEEIDKLLSIENIFKKEK